MKYLIIVAAMAFAVTTTGCSKSEEQQIKEATDKSIVVPPAKSADPRTSENKSY